MDVLGIAVANAQAEAEITNAMKRQAERHEKMELWQDPELMILRKAKHEKGAIESLLILQANGQSVAKPPLPPDSELPPEMRGQQPSTVRAWMASKPKYAEAFKHAVTLEDARQTARNDLLKRYPELGGIDFQLERKKAKVEFGEEHKVRTNHKVKIGGAVDPPTTVAPKTMDKEEAKSLMSKIYAGIFRK